MRYAAVLCIAATPVSAWEASSEGPVCRLTQTLDGGTLEITHDPRRALPYAIDIARDTPWTNGPLFAMRFDGPGPLTITTDRHALSDGDTALTVMDRGFGNVLAGLENNFVAMAVLGNEAITIPLAGAAPEVAKFRDCASGLGV